MTTALGMPAPIPAPGPLDVRPRVRSTGPSRGAETSTSHGLLDRFGRTATDLRVSLGDRCNLRCTYCMPEEGLPVLPADEALSTPEIVRLARVAVERLGVTKIRLTGGEPLLRADLVEIVSALAALEPRPELALTTNAIGLASRAGRLRAAGLDRLNVSLDTLHADTFERMTRRPFLRQVMSGLDAALAAGFDVVKVNAVLLRGVNDHEAVELVEWALDRGLELRFIEQMPLDADHSWSRVEMVTAAEIRERLAERYTLAPTVIARDGAPAELFDVRDRDGALLGRVGVIASVTEPFCDDCRRTRLTADGRVRSCLFSHDETDLLGPLRGGVDDATLADLWRGAMWAKPAGHNLSDARFRQPERTMSAIGG